MKLSSTSAEASGEEPSARHRKSARGDKRSARAGGPDERDGDRSARTPLASSRQSGRRAMLPPPGAEHDTLSPKASARSGGTVWSARNFPSLFSASMDGLAADVGDYAEYSDYSDGDLYDDGADEEPPAVPLSPSRGNRNSLPEVAHETVSAPEPPLSPTPPPAPAAAASAATFDQLIQDRIPATAPASDRKPQLKLRLGGT